MSARWHTARPLVIAFWGGLVVLGAAWALEAAAGPHAELNRWGFSALATTRRSLLGRHRLALLHAGNVAAIAVTAFTIGGAAARGWWRTAVAIVVGFAVSDGLSTLIKVVMKVHRPADQVIHATGWSFPSSDAALSVGFVAVAATLAHLSGGRLPRRVALTGGVLASAATGLLTIALRDHRLTDVVAGWGLGAVVFALCLAAGEAEVADAPARRGPTPLQF